MGRGALLLAEIYSVGGKGSQIVTLDVCPFRGVLVCGDIMGRVMAYHIPPALLSAGPTGSPSYHLHSAKHHAENSLHM